MGNEIVEIITDELIDFFASYIVMTSMTHGAMLSFVDDKNILFDAKKCVGSYDSRYGVTRYGRTKLNFYFYFYSDELEFALKLVRLLDGYVEYYFSAESEGYYYNFKFDAGDQEHATLMFEKIKGLS